MRDLPTTEYDLLDLLDRVEELLEDMADLQVENRVEAEQLMAAIRTRLDDLDPARA